MFKKKSLERNIIKIACLSSFIMLISCERKDINKCMKSNRNVKLPVLNYVDQKDFLNTSIFKLLKYYTRYGINEKWTNEKMVAFDGVKEIRGKAVQLLRFSCWLLERDPKIRKIIINQWLGQMRYEHKIPPIDYVKSIIDAVLNCEDAKIKDVRIMEIEEVYLSLDNKTVYGIDEKEYFFGRRAEEVLQPFIDEGQPFGSVLFSGNPKKIEDAYKESLKIRDIPVEDINKIICPEDDECVYDLAIKKILRVDNKKAR